MQSLFCTTLPLNSDAQVHSEWPVRVTLVRTGESFSSHVQPKKTANNQWMLKATQAMKALFNKVHDKTCPRRAMAAAGMLTMWSKIHKHPCVVERV
jgi:hypothetical protein